MPIKPIKPMGRSINHRPWYYYPLVIVLWLAMMGFFALVAVEWAAGCGESYTDANGVEHQYECLILDRFKP
jgi:hypothetical protein